MGNRMFLGNLPWATTSEDLAALLKDEGYAIVSAKVITDRETGKSRGREERSWGRGRAPRPSRSARQRLVEK